MRELAFTADDGVEVFYRRWVADDPVRGVVLIVHGASEHSGRYARFATVLGENGLAAYALDLRGHGGSSASTGPGRLGARGIDGVLADVEELERRARSDFPTLPVVLFGHSMGSLVTQVYVERFGEGLAGYVLSGTGGVPEDASEMSQMVRDAMDAGMGDEPLDLLGEFNASFEPARTRYDWLSRDPEEVDRYVADPWCGDDAPLTYGYVAALLASAERAMEPDELARVPKHTAVLLITGEADPTSNGGLQVRALEQRLRDAGLLVAARYYPDARHELLNEINRDDVSADVVAWIDGVLREP